jgi:hypothetical protein
MKVNGLLHAPATLFTAKEPPIPMGYETGRIPEPVWTLWRRKKSLATAGNRTTIPWLPSSSSPIYGLSYPGS